MIPSQVYGSALLVVGVIVHSVSSKPIKYACRRTKKVTQNDILDNRISPRLLAAYWQTVATNANQNPQMGRRGRPRQEKEYKFKATTKSKRNPETRTQTPPHNNKDKFYIKTRYRAEHATIGNWTNWTLKVNPQTTEGGSQRQLHCHRDAHSLTSRKYEPTPASA